MRTDRFRIPLTAFLSILFVAGCASNREPQGSSSDAGQGPNAAVDSVDVFESGKLAQRLSSFPGLTLVEKLGHWTTYTRPSDKLRFQGAELNSISYNFYDDIFYSAHVEVLGSGNVQKLLKWVEKTYGPSHTTDIRDMGPKLTKLVVREWRGARVDFVFKYAQDHAGGTLIYVDHKMWESFDLPRRAKAQAMSRAFQGSWSNLDFD